MSRDTRWGRSYQDGDLILTVLDNENRLLIADEHTGDRLHNFIPLRVSRSKTQPDSHLHVTAEEGPGRSGYFIGLVVGHLDRDQMRRIGNGIDIQKPSVKLGDIELDIVPPEGPQRQFTT